MSVSFAAEGTTNILINQYIARWGCPKYLMWGHGLLMCSLGHRQYRRELISSQRQRSRRARQPDDGSNDANSGQQAAERPGCAATSS